MNGTYLQATIMTDIRLFFGEGPKTIDATINTPILQPYTTMNKQSETQEFDEMFAGDMAEVHKLYSMTEKISLRLKVMKETYEQVMPIHYENGYIQGFKDRYEGIQPRYKDINDKSHQWYDYSSMEMHRLDELKSKKLQNENERLKDENQETIKTLQVERDEFQLALRKAQDNMMTLRARSRDIQYDSQRTNDEMIDLKKKCHKFSCQLQDDNHILKEENKENQETIKRLQVERDEFQLALRKAQDVLMEWIREDKEEKMNLRSRTCDLQHENWALITVNKENQEKMKRLETQFQSSVVKAETLQTDIHP